ncbi:low affinity iron permease family protein [Pararobbsia alpina]|uniref:low affinity iron permease family protein n=1 Tax=Pararobbsia alpina TaxID=621374 RepID=UPI00158361FC
MSARGTLAGSNASTTIVKFRMVFLIQNTRNRPRLLDASLRPLRPGQYTATTCSDLH